MTFFEIKKKDLFYPIKNYIAMKLLVKSFFLSFIIKKVTFIDIYFLIDNFESLIRIRVNLTSHIIINNNDRSIFLFITCCVRDLTPKTNIKTF